MTPLDTASPVPGHGVDGERYRTALIEHGTLRPLAPEAPRGYWHAEPQTLRMRGPATVPARLDLCEVPPASAYWVPFGDARDDGPPRRGPRGGRNREAA